MTGTESSQGVLQELRESPGEKCIHVATGWGPVFLRRDQNHGHHWTKTVRFLNGDWCESRVYSDERQELLSHEHSVLPMSDYPRGDDE
ncbi:hypothetical protein [Halomarina oriensis]|uniref:Uncharacterized protein n=1 Tax=Halomarina oriensis TaxID=671145 RepID=A0A6B0GR00_9EURY|nr:hypothetical protein [Halomarina oriensis]MWG36511.1 hypothetical protein [Halomarina oriensis]